MGIVRLPGAGIAWGGADVTGERHWRLYVTTTNGTLAIAKIEMFQAATQAIAQATSPTGS
jgi:hypothetical protein